MKRLGWIGAPFFGANMAALGWETAVREFLKPRVVGWDDVVSLCGFAPDVLVLGDTSAPPVLTGLENFPCLTVFYSVDSHIHEWHAVYAQAFDLCLVSLRDHLPRYVRPRLNASRALWSPPYARDDDRPRETPKTMDAVFVGKDDPVLTPVRSRLLAELRGRFPGFSVRQGNYREIYPQARLVLNVAERGDMNFRLFEALGCGACLVTPEIGHGFSELFTNGRDLFTYPQNDVDALAWLMEELLSDAARRERAAAAGLAKVDAGHRASHRAAAFDGWLAGQPAEALVAERLRDAGAIFEAALRPLYLHWAEALPGTPHAAAYLAAAQRGAKRRGTGRSGA